jgi:lysozyme
MNRKINQAGLELIKMFEGFRSYPYKDSAGIWTIGYGHTKEINAFSTPITEDVAEDLLRADLAEAERTVSTLVNVALNDSQYSALVSLVFNTGIAPLTHTLGLLLNAREYEAAADEFLKWNHAGGIVSNGLSRRREAERKLFLS